MSRAYRNESLFNQHVERFRPYRPSIRVIAFDNVFVKVLVRRDVQSATLTVNISCKVVGSHRRPQVPQNLHFTKIADQPKLGFTTEEALLY